MDKINESDIMRRALRLALKGRGNVSPNPRVGAVVVSRRGEIIGQGYHHRVGDWHAEVDALNHCQGDTRGATIFVNLEPCCIQGRTPPCSQAILRAGVGRVVASIQDPYPPVNGKGFEVLRQAGVQIETGLLAEQASYLNRGYLSAQLRGRAWCTVKVALSLDGKMANPEKLSKWITGPEARKLAHTLRADHDAVLVGGGTVASDNPELTVRSVRGPNPVRLILSPRRGISGKGKIAQLAMRVRTIIITGKSSTPPGSNLKGLELLTLPEKDYAIIDPLTILKALPKLGILSVLVEGGSQVLSSFMEAGVVDEIQVGIAPSVVGRGIAPFDEFQPRSWDTRPKFKISNVKRYGEDVVIRFNRREGLFSPD